MSTEVYANGREISAKASGNKSIAAMPGPCLSPPSPPAGPIPIPYPNFSKAADLTGGSKNVKIKGKEVGLKNVSTYKSSKGNEAATRNFGMGVITHTIQGKTKFAAWSFDVKVEGKNVTRFMDLTTHNHMNQGDAVTSSIGKPGVGIAPNPECVALSLKNEQERDKLKNKTKDKTLVGPDGNGKGTTVSSCNFTPSSGGASWTKSSHSRQKATEKLPDSFSAGGDMDNRKEGKSNLCPEANHTHAKPTAQKSGHGEARLLDELFKDGGKGPGTATFSIDWRKKKGKPSKMPCRDCHKMMCAAKKCDIEIYLCGKDNQKHKLDDSHCPPTQANRRALKKKLDGK